MTDPNVSMRSVLLRGGLLALFMMIVPSESVAAQELRGTVSEASTGDPIASVQVWLQTAEGEDERLTFTAEDGSFLIEPDSAGIYRIEARRQGYETTTSESFSWPDDSDPIELRMSVRPVEIDGIEIEAQADIRLEHQATYGGLLRRASNTPPVGTRRVYLRNQLEPDDFRTVAEYVRQKAVPGTRTGCRPAIVYVPFESPFEIPGNLKQNYLSMKVRDMDAIEIYGRAAEAPLGVRPSGPGCGVVVLWPRRASSDPDGGRR